VTEKEKALFLKWAKQATAGLDESAFMIGVLDDRNSSGRLEFELQIGHALVNDKPLVLIAPTTANPPAKLIAAASAFETFIAGDKASMMHATERALAKVGLTKRH
jgi:hypothetical protein